MKQNIMIIIKVMHLSSASWGGGGGGRRADVGEYGDFMQILQQNFCPCGGGNVGT